MVDGLAAGGVVDLGVLDGIEDPVPDAIKDDGLGAGVKPELGIPFEVVLGHITFDLVVRLKP